MKMVHKDGLKFKNCLLAPEHVVPKKSQNYYSGQHKDGIKGLYCLTYCNLHYLLAFGCVFFFTCFRKSWLFIEKDFSLTKTLLQLPLRDSRESNTFQAVLNHQNKTPRVEAPEAQPGPLNTKSKSCHLSLIFM